jgi:hypothetical protein
MNNQKRDLYEVEFQFDRGDAFENAANPWTQKQIVCKYHIGLHELEGDSDVLEINPVTGGECGYCKLDKDG